MPATRNKERVNTARRDGPRRRRSPSAAAARLIELDLTDLSHGPAAIGRDQGRVVFVRGGAPGDRVRARLHSQKKSFAEGEVVEVLQPGAVRREPPCPHVSRCGGCPWQHIDYPGQLAAKLANVRREVARLESVRGESVAEAPGATVAATLGATVAAAPGEIVAEVLAAPAEWGYRQRVRLHVDERRRVGYQRPRSHTVVPIDVCPIAHPDVVRHFEVARSLAAALGTQLDTIELLAHPIEPGVVMTLTAAGACARGDRAVITALLRQVPSVFGVFIHGPGWGWQLGELNVPAGRLADGTPVEVPAPAFTQANLEGNQLLIDSVLEAVAPQGDERVLELHAGAGNFTSMLAPRVASLRAVERHRRAVRSLAALVEDRGWRHLEVEEAEAGSALERLVDGGEQFDVVIADPPRTGMADEVPLIGRLAPRRVVYVSCDLATLMRDLRLLMPAGYELRRVQPIDLFPQTYHIELVATLERSG